MRYNSRVSSKVSKEGSVIKDLNSFRKQIEKYFFADVNIQIINQKLSPNIPITIELNCNFGLTESLFHLTNNNWGGFCKNSLQQGNNRFLKTVNELQERNDYRIVIEEFTIHFEDTSLFISKIPNQNISDQLCSILGAISEHYVHFTKGLTEMPYEIFVPVFEEPIDIHSSDMSLTINKVNNSYFNYWGLYFHSQLSEDSSVYDTNRKTITDGDFSLVYKE